VIHRLEWNLFLDSFSLSMLESISMYNNINFVLSFRRAVIRAPSHSFTRRLSELIDSHIAPVTHSHELLSISRTIQRERTDNSLNLSVPSSLPIEVLGSTRSANIIYSTARRPL